MEMGGLCFLKSYLHLNLNWQPYENTMVAIVSTDLNYWIKHPFEFSDPILKPEYL